MEIKNTFFPYRPSLFAALQPINLRHIIYPAGIEFTNCSFSKMIAVFLFQHAKMLTEKWQLVQNKKSCALQMGLKMIQKNYKLGKEIT